MQILKSEIEQVQKNWVNAIIGISQAFFEGEDYRSLAMDFTEDLYAFDTCDVLLKPLFARENPFRNDKLSAIAYLIGGNPNFKEDTGFAIREWKSIKFINEGFAYKDDMTVSMGLGIYEDGDGNIFKSEESMGFIIDKNKDLRINLHHSSLSNPQ